MRNNVDCSHLDEYPQVWLGYEFQSFQFSINNCDNLLTRIPVAHFSHPLVAHSYHLASKSKYVLRLFPLVNS